MKKRIIATIVALTLALAIIAVPAVSIVVAVPETVGTITSLSDTVTSLSDTTHDTVTAPADTAPVDAPVVEAPETAPVDAPVVESPKIVGTPTITNDAQAFHTHMWEMYGQGSNSFQVICEGCGTFVSVPTDDFACEHQFKSGDNGVGLCMTYCTKCDYNVQKRHVWTKYSDLDGHGEVCSDCGLISVTEHNFETEFDATSHWEYCVECGYQTAPVEHHLRNDFWCNTHEVVCDECWFTASRHAGVTWEDNGKDCTATCHCGATETLGHEWSGFECCNCEHVFSGPTAAVVSSITPRLERYIVGFDVNGEHHYIYLDDVNFAEGDFVVIEHNGNEIDSINVVVSHDIVDDPRNLIEYASEIIADMFEHMSIDVKLYDTVLKSHGLYENRIELEYTSHGVTIYDAEYEIYDLRTGSVSETLCNGDAVLYYFAGEVVYLLIVW